MLNEVPNNSVTLTQEVIDSVSSEWEQLKSTVKRQKRKYRLIDLDTLGILRSSRWYTSFSLSNNKVKGAQSFWGPY